MPEPFKRFGDDDLTVLRNAGFSAWASCNLAAGVCEAREMAERWRVGWPQSQQETAQYRLNLRRSVESWSEGERLFVEWSLGGLWKTLWGKPGEKLRPVDLLAEIGPVSKSAASTWAAKRERKGDGPALRWLMLLLLDLADAVEPDLGKLTMRVPMYARAGVKMPAAEAGALKRARTQAHTRAAHGLLVARQAFGSPLRATGDMTPLGAARNEVQRALRHRRAWVEDLPHSTSLGGPEAWDRTTGAGAGLALLRLFRPLPGQRHYWPPGCEPPGWDV